MPLSAANCTKYILLGSQKCLGVLNFVRHVAITIAISNAANFGETWFNWRILYKQSSNLSWQALEVPNFSELIFAGYNDAMMWAYFAAINCDLEIPGNGLRSSIPADSEAIIAIALNTTIGTIVPNPTPCPIFVQHLNIKIFWKYQTKRLDEKKFTKTTIDNSQIRQPP